MSAQTSVILALHARFEGASDECNARAISDSIRERRRLRTGEVEAV